MKPEASPLATGVSNKNIHIHNYVLGFSLQYAEHISLIIISSSNIFITIFIIVIIIIIIIIIFVIKELVIT